MFSRSNQRLSKTYPC